MVDYFDFSEHFHFVQEFHGIVLIQTTNLNDFINFVGHLPISIISIKILKQEEVQNSSRIIQGKLAHGGMAIYLVSLSSPIDRPPCPFA